MADNVSITSGSGTDIAADEVVDGTLGTVKVQYVKLMDGTLDGDTKAAVGAGGLKVDLGADNDVTVTGTVDLGAVDNAVLDQIELNQDSQTAILATIDTDTGAMATSLGSLDNAVDGNYLNVNGNIAGTDMVSGSGTATGALRVELPTNGTGVVGLNAGTNAIGKLAANSGVDIGDVDVTSIAAGTNNIGQVSVAPQTANGLSVFNATSSDGATALTSTAQVIKASAGQLYGWYIYNPNTTAQFVQLYNTAAGSVTVGTTSPLFMLTIPALSAANVEYTNGVTFSNAGWSTAATSTAGGNGAPTTALDAVFFYK